MNIYIKGMHYIILCFIIKKWQFVFVFTFLNMFGDIVVIQSYHHTCLTNWGKSITFTCCADLNSLPHSDYVGFCDPPPPPPPPPIQITQDFEPSLPYKFMHTHMSLHVNLHAYLIIVYPLTFTHTIIEYVMLNDGL